MSTKMPPLTIVPPAATGGRHTAKPRRHVTGGKGVPPSLAGVSHAVAVGPFCHTGGQLAIDASGCLVNGTAGEQAAVAFANLLAVLHAAGFTRRDIVFLDIALADLAELPDVNAAFHRVFRRPPRPARAVAAVAALPLGARVRLHALAIKAPCPTVFPPSSERT